MLDIKPQSFSDEFRLLRDEQDLMYLKGCRREVLLGRIDALRFLPENHEGVVVYTGRDAYKYMLIYVTGLISRTRGESQIVSQFKGAYREWHDRAPALATEFNRFIRSIIHDNGLVRNIVTYNLKPAFYEACAHELSQQTGADTVLVVVNSDKSRSKPDDLTENIVKYLSNNRKGAAQKIVFTHPDPQVLQNIYSHFLRQKSKGHITSEIEMRPFENAFDATSHLQWMNRVYVCLPMGSYPGADEVMLKQWGQKEALGGTLIHLGGSKKADRQSSGVWSGDPLFNYVTPEKILGWQEIRKGQNEKIIEVGKKACGVCADIRQDNKRPNQEALSSISTTLPQRPALPL